VFLEDHRKFFGAATAEQLLVDRLYAVLATLVHHHHHLHVEQHRLLEVADGQATDKVEVGVLSLAQNTTAGVAALLVPPPPAAKELFVDE
jgi:uncharacterized protein YjlB